MKIIIQIFGDFMEKAIRIVAQCYDVKTGTVIEELLVRDDKLEKAKT
jgi:hypothetical protein